MRAPAKKDLSGLYAAGMVLTEIGLMEQNKEVGLLGFGLSLDQWKGHWCEEAEKQEDLVEVDDGMGTAGGSVRGAAFDWRLSISKMFLELKLLKIKKMVCCALVVRLGSGI